MAAETANDLSRWKTAKSLIPRIALFFILLGVALRFLRLGLNFPLWGDEAFVALNFLDSDFLSLAKPLRHYQIAPLGFLWIEKVMVILLGTSEFAVRLAPCLAGTLALFISLKGFKAITRRKTALLSLAILAVSYYPIRHACEAKPYAFDLLAASIFFWFGSKALGKNSSQKPVFLLALLAPFLLFTSFPAAFSAGAVCIALGFHILHQKKYNLVFPTISLSLSIAASFSAHYLIVGNNQYNNELAKHQAYWDSTFPPVNLFQFPTWLLKTHAGNLSAYPLGGKDGASAITFLLFLSGIFALVRKSNFSLLLLLLAPFALNLVAAFMGRYPYGGSARVAQHLAPSICLLMAIGALSILNLKTFYKIRLKAFFGILLVLILFAFIQAIRDVKKPYKSPGDLQARSLVRELCSNLPPGQPLIITRDKDLIDPTLEWYLKTQRNKIAWTAEDKLQIIAMQNRKFLWLWLPFRLPGGDTQPAVEIPIIHDVRCEIKKEFSFALGRDTKIKPQMVLVEVSSGESP